MDSQKLRRAVLEGLHPRGGGQGGYTKLEVEGASDDEIEAMVKRLANEGLLNATFVRQRFGPDGRARVEPSTLTDKGRDALGRNEEADDEPT